MNLLHKVAGCLIVIVVVTAAAYGQHSSSAQQTVTFGVIRSPQLHRADVASTGKPTLPYVASSAQGSQEVSGGAIAKVTFSSKPQPKSFQSITDLVDGISAGASILAWREPHTDVGDIQMDARTLAQSGSSLLRSAEPLVITITD